MGYDRIGLLDQIRQSGDLRGIHPYPPIMPAINAPCMDASIINLYAHPIDQDIIADDRCIINAPRSDRFIQNIPAYIRPDIYAPDANMPPYGGAISESECPYWARQVMTSGVESDASSRHSMINSLPRGSLIMLPSGFMVVWAGRE